MLKAVNSVLRVLHKLRVVSYNFASFVRVLFWHLFATFVNCPKELCVGRLGIKIRMEEN